MRGRIGLQAYKTQHPRQSRTVTGLLCLSAILRMPSDSFFGFSVLVAGRPVPEYVQRGRVFVESNLHTPFSYNQQTEELVNGEKEVQSTPVTPYQVFIHLAPHCEMSAIFIYVDGVRVTKLLLEKGQSK